MTVTPGEVDDTHVVRLQPNRGPGYFYGGLAAFVLVLVLIGVVSNLVGGHLVFALVTLVVGAGVTGFLVLLAVAILGPTLDVSAAGVSGRTTFRRPLDLGWEAVAITVADEAPPGQFQIVLGADSYAVNGRSWTGFRDFVFLSASTPAAVDRMSPAAQLEMIRLIGIAGGGVSDVSGPDA